MDKFEYKVRAEEIKVLIAKGDYAQAADIADTVDWRRVKSVMMLCTISDLYKINRRFEDARDMLLLAYERHPGGRTIVYSLCELSIKMEEFVPAVEYYKEFVQIAPKDTGRYILQYKLYEAQDVGLEERIAVLEELKKRDYREKWAYELAYLYHRVGLSTRCVEECDELILWFGEGKYVIKAMELKMLHQPLTPSQQRKYDDRFAPQPVYEEYDEEVYDEYGEEQPEETMDQMPAVNFEPAPAEDELDIQVKTMDVSQYNTINLQKELAEGLAEVLGEKHDSAADSVTRSIMAPMMESDTETLDFPQIEEVDENALEPEEVGSEVFFSETGEIDMSQEPAYEAEVVNFPEGRILSAGDGGQTPVQKVIDWENGDHGDMVKDDTAELVMDQMRQEADTAYAEKREFPQEQPDAGAVETDENSSLAVTESDQLENQVTGQLSIEDILAEWEQIKKENEENRKEAVRQRVMEHTGSMFTEFEASVRDGLLEQLEKRKNEEQAALREADAPAGGLSSSEMEDSDEVEELTEIEELTEDFSELPQESEDVFGDGLSQEEPEVQDQEIIQQREHRVIGFQVPGAAAEEPDKDGEEAFTGSEDSMSQSETCDEDAPGAGDDANSADGGKIDAAGDPYEGREMGWNDFSEQGQGDCRNSSEGSEGPYEESTEESAADYEDAEEVSDDSYEDYTEERSAAYEDVAQEDEGAYREYTEERSADYEDVAEEGEDSCEEHGQERSDGEDYVGDGKIAYKDSAEDGKNADKISAQDVHRDYEDASEDKEADSRRTSEDDQAAGDAIAGEHHKARIRSLTREERELYGSFIQNKSARERLVTAIDTISMAAYTGNVIVTGDEGMDTMTLAKNMVREIQLNDSNFSGKTAKISGDALNKKDVSVILEQLKNGALIVQKASGMNSRTAQNLYKGLQQEELGIIVILEDTKKAVNKFLAANKDLEKCFNARMDLEALSNESLVAFGRKYARELEYSIDELGVLALHTRIEDMQTSDHAVTVMEVKEIMDEAIRHASKKSMGHFFDVLLAKRYDDEDMIILREKDFV